MNPYLDIQNLTKSFGELLLFENLNMSIGEGQRVGLIAKNGTGKSTLLSIINGNEGYDSGDIIFRKGLRVGYLMQSPNFNPDESVLDACFRTTIKEEDDRAERDAKMLKAKQILTKLKIRNLEQPMRELSGGQQKRVALANVLITEPDLLILDEPSSNLDAKAEERVFESFADLCVGRTGILISHRLSNMMSVDRILVLEQGSIVEQGTHQDLMGADGLYAKMYRIQAESYRI